jgi:hypothetical protein
MADVMISLDTTGSMAAALAGSATAVPAMTTGAAVRL